jgi:hypothetical protein
LSLSPLKTNVSGEYRSLGLTQAIELGNGLRHYPQLWAVRKHAQRSDNPLFAQVDCKESSLESIVVLGPRTDKQLASPISVVNCPIFQLFISAVSRERLKE